MRENYEVEGVIESSMHIYKNYTLLHPEICCWQSYEGQVFPYELYEQIQILFCFRVLILIQSFPEAMVENVEIEGI